MNKGRDKPKNCQIEPSYPEHETILFSIRNIDYYVENKDYFKEVKIKKFNKNK